MNVNPVAFGVRYALYEQHGYTGIWPTYCGRLYALMLAFTGFDPWTGQPMPYHRQASFADRFLAANQMIRDGVIKPDGSATHE